MISRAREGFFGILAAKARTLPETIGMSPIRISITVRAEPRHSRFHPPADNDISDPVLFNEERAAKYNCLRMVGSIECQSLLLRRRGASAPDTEETYRGAGDRMNKIK